MATDYPTTLPIPQTASVTPFDRAQLSNGDRPREARALSTDRLAVVRATWPPLSPADAAVFQEWWQVQIYEGGAWFNATWPLPQGTVEAVFRFIEQPRWRFVPGGRWRIEGVLEQRGRGLSVIDGPNTGSPSTPWNSENELGAVTFSDGDFTASFNAGATVVSLGSVESALGNGKYYAELVPTFTLLETGASTVQLGITIANPGGPIDGAGIELQGAIRVDNSVAEVIDPVSSGDVIMIALDALNSLVYFGINGTWLSGADPVTGDNAFGVPVSDFYWLTFYGDNVEATYFAAIRTGTDRFSYPVPSGYTAWNVQGA